jgi:hypothetical protein
MPERATGRPKFWGEDVVDLLLASEMCEEGARSQRDAGNTYAEERERALSKRLANLAVRIEKSLGVAS